MIMTVIELLLFTIAILSQLVFPCKNRKGNLRYTLFIFFSGLIDRLGHFEYNGFSARAITQQKQVRKLLLVAASFLFFLSSFELSPTVSPDPVPATVYCKPPTNHTTESRQVNTPRLIDQELARSFAYTNSSSAANVDAVIPPRATVKRYLLICTFRI